MIFVRALLPLVHPLILRLHQFEKSIEFERQFNVLDAKKTQPSIERIIFETVKALKCFTVSSVFNSRLSDD